MNLLNQYRQSRKLKNVKAQLNAYRRKMGDFIDEEEHLLTIIGIIIGAIALLALVAYIVYEFAGKDEVEEDDDDLFDDCLFDDEDDVE